MAVTENSTAQLRGLAKSLFDGARNWWRAGFVSRLAVVVCGVASLFASGTKPLFLGFGSLALTLACEIFLWRSDWLRGLAEGAQRKFDFIDGFGGLLSSEEWSAL